MAKTEKKAKPEQEAKKNAEPQAETPDTETAAAEAEAQAPDTQPDEAAPDARLQELEAQLLQANDKFLRTLAEYDNYRKRSVREKEQAYADSKAAVLTEFLPVLDNFERAQAGADASYEDYRKGVEMIFSQLAACFEKLGAESFGEVGDVFDPNIHNAVMHTEDETAAENTIVQVFSKGYKLGDKILRPAVVKVVN